jgi:hypothetical protein
MNRLLTLGLTMLAGVAVGALAVHDLHAQAKPSVYYIAEIDVTNPEAYAKEFAPKAQAIIKAHGGRFVAIGGSAGTGPKGLMAIDGDPPKRASSPNCGKVSSRWLTDKMPRVGAHLA